MGERLHNRLTTLMLGAGIGSAALALSGCEQAPATCYITTVGIPNPNPPHHDSTTIRETILYSLQSQPLNLTANDLQEYHGLQSTSVDVDGDLVQKHQQFNGGLYVEPGDQVEFCISGTKIMPGDSAQNIPVELLPKSQN
ncbi:MAG TPA: hypothetical protein VFL85_01425 [Candidatus Saccharimonadales bacterium]|nr:hypothetical protein [Candidatus Saccharimonadales bacterium]